MSKSILVGAAVAAALSAGGANAASRSTAAPWVISPMDAACKVDLELTGRSGGTVPVVLASDGETITLRFAKEELPERAFLPIRVDQKPYSNIMRRAADGSGELTLSDATQAALRKGGTLSIAWLSEEPVSAALAGSENGVPDLRTCGAQVAGEARTRAAAAADTRARAEADGRAQAIAQAQVQAAHAQQAVAEAEARRHDAEAERQQAQAQAALEQQRYLQVQAQREQAYQDAQRQRAAYDAQRQQEYDRYQAPAYQQPAYQAAPQYYPAPQPSYWPPTPRYAYRRY